MGASVKVQEYYGGRRLLFASEAEYELVWRELTNESRVKVHLHGSNKFNDRSEYPYYVFVRRRADGLPLEREDFDYLEAFASRSENAPNDLDEESESRPEAREAPTSENTALLDELRTVSKTILELRRSWQESTASLSDRIDEVNSALLEEIRSSRQMLTTESEDTSEELFDEYLDRERAFVDQERAYRQEIAILTKNEAYLRQRIEELKRGAEQEKAIQDELSASLDEAHAEKNTTLSKDVLNLVKEIVSCDITAVFERCLKDIAPPLEFVRLTEAIRKAKQGLGDVKSVKKTGKEAYSELRCNLGRGKGTGRLFYKKKGDGVTLLGFVDDHDREEALIREIDMLSL